MSPQWNWVIQLPGAALSGMLGNACWALTLAVFARFLTVLKPIWANPAGIETPEESGGPQDETKPPALVMQARRTRLESKTVFAGLVFALALDAWILCRTLYNGFPVAMFVGVVAAELTVITAISIQDSKQPARNYKDDPFAQTRLKRIIIVAFWGFFWCLISAIAPFGNNGPLLLKLLAVFCLFAAGSYVGFVSVPRWGFKAFSNTVALIMALSLLLTACWPGSLPSLWFVLARDLSSQPWFASIFPPPHIIAIDTLKSVDNLKFVDPVTGIPTLFYTQGNANYVLADGPGFDHLGNKFEPAIDQRDPIVAWVGKKISESDQKIEHEIQERTKLLAAQLQQFKDDMGQAKFDAAIAELDKIPEENRANWPQDLLAAELHNLPPPGQLREPAASQRADELKHTLEFDPDRRSIIQLVRQRLHDVSKESPDQTEDEVRFSLDLGMLSNTETAELIFPAISSGATDSDLRMQLNQLLAIQSAIQSWDALEAQAVSLMQQFVAAGDANDLARLLSQGDLGRRLATPLCQSIEKDLGNPDREELMLKLLTQLKQDPSHLTVDSVSPTAISNAIAADAQHSSDPAELQWLGRMCADWNLDKATAADVYSKLLSITPDDDPQLIARTMALLQTAENQPPPNCLRKLFLAEFLSANWPNAQHWLELAQEQNLLSPGDDARVAKMRAWFTLNKSLKALLAAETDIVLRKSGTDSTTGRSFISPRTLRLNSVDDDAFSGVIRLGAEDDQRVHGCYSPNEIALTFDDAQAGSGLQLDSVDPGKLLSDPTTAWGPITCDDLVFHGRDSDGRVWELLLPAPDSYPLTSALGRPAMQDFHAPTVEGGRIPWDCVEFRELFPVPVQNLNINRPVMLRGKLEASDGTIKQWSLQPGWITTTLAVASANHVLQRYTIARLNPQKTWAPVTIALPSNAQWLTFQTRGYGSVVLTNFRMYPLDAGRSLPRIIQSN